MKLLEKETNTYWEALVMIAEHSESLIHAQYIAKSALKDAGWSYDPSPITQRQGEDKAGGGEIESWGEVVYLPTDSDD